MADNFNLSLEGPSAGAEEAAGLNPNNPAMTYVDFANQIVRNSQTQQQQAAQVQQAQALAKQYGIRAGQMGAAAEAGVNPELKDYASVDEATAFMKSMGMDDDTINEFVKSLNGQQYVDRSDLRAFIAKKQGGSKVGAAFVASDVDAKNPNKTDENGDPLVAGQSYQAFINANGDVQYQLGGGEAAVGKADALSLKESEADEKQWQKLDEEMNKFTRPGRGNTLVQAVQRASRALNELTNGQPLTSQVLGFIHDDIAGIFQGGMPPVTGKDATSFLTVKDNINQIIGKYTGRFNFFGGDIGTQRPYLTQLVSRLLVSTENMLETEINSEKSGYQKIINANPARWQKMVTDKTGVVLSGLESGAAQAVSNEGLSQGIPGTELPTGMGSLPSATNPTSGQTPPKVAAGSAPQTGNIDAIAAALGLKKKVQ